MSNRQAKLLKTIEYSTARLCKQNLLVGLDDLSQSELASNDIGSLEQLLVLALCSPNLVISQGFCEILASVRFPEINHLFVR